MFLEDPLAGKVKSLWEMGGLWETTRTAHT